MHKLAFIATSYIRKYDGVSVYSENLLQQLLYQIDNIKREIKLDIFVREDSYDLLKERIIIPKEINRYANINFISVSGKSYPTRLLKLTAMLYKRGKYDLVYMPNPMPVIFTPGKKMKTIHDFSFKIAPEYYSTFEKIYSDFLRKIAIKFDDAIGYISQSTKKDFERFYGITDKDKTFIYLPNGIPFKVQKQERPSKEDFEKKFTQKKLKILIVGRINRHKGFDRVLRFVKYLDSISKEDKQFENIQIHIVGKKTKETDELLNDYKPQNVQLNFPGFISDEELNVLYKTSHFCFFLSRNEGYGLPLVESLWLKTIPVLSNIPIFREIMEEDYPLFEDKNLEENIYKFIKNIFNEKDYREKIYNHIEKVVKKEKKGYEIAAKNLLNYIGYTRNEK
ncbi:MAG: glycosyltransferase family 4 protein [Aquificae bacterium]|nr:glycosyltransferase family 4 protein [Aquificota bacterium]